jgi:folate-binding protein YgfZ
VSALALHELHAGLGAQFSAVNGMEVVAHYGEAAAEHRALRETAGVLDLGFRGRLCLLGADRTTFLHGQVTNDVKKLRVGDGCHATLVTHKGRMEGDLYIWNLGEELLLDFEPGLAAAVAQRLEKFIVAEDAQVVDVAPHYGLLSVQGPRSAEVVAALGMFASDPLLSPSFSSIPNGREGARRAGEEASGAWLPTHRLLSVNDPTLGQLYLMNQPRLRTTGFDLFVPMNSLAAVADKLIAAARAVDGCACGWDALETARIEAGVPRFGADLDETTLPPEAGLDVTAVSYNKGCYIGQEVLNRIHTIGHVNRKLVGLRLSAGTSALPRRGDKLLRDGKEIGVITSAVCSPVFAHIALGFVRREYAETGTEVQLPNGTIARVAPLPLRL